MKFWTTDRGPLFKTKRETIHFLLGMTTVTIISNLIDWVFEVK